MGYDLVTLEITSSAAFFEKQNVLVTTTIFLLLFQCWIVMVKFKSSKFWLGVFLQCHIF